MLDALEQRTQPFTARGFARAIGSSPDYVLAEIRAGRLPAFRRGRWFMIDPREGRAWLETKRVRATAHAEAVVERVLAREDHDLAP